jgi:hypothetical protein
MASTLALDPDTWDLMVNDQGDIAVASDPDSLAQDAASAVKTFQGEVYFDVSLGIPYLSQILGKSPSLPLVKQRMVEAALTVAGVAAAQCYLTAFTDREIAGQVQVVGQNGEVAAADFSVINPQTGAVAS